MERIPEALEAKLKLFRMGVISIPQEYINWHEVAALKAMHSLRDNYIIHKEELVNDGFLDGMKFIQLIIENKNTQKLYKIKWSDYQTWYYQCAGGWAPFNQI